MRAVKVVQVRIGLRMRHRYRGRKETRDTRGVKLARPIGRHLITSGADCRPETPISRGIRRGQPIVLQPEREVNGAV